MTLDGQIAVAFDPRRTGGEGTTLASSRIAANAAREKGAGP